MDRVRCDIRLAEGGIVSHLAASLSAKSSFVNGPVIAVGAHGEDSNSSGREPACLNAQLISIERAFAMMVPMRAFLRAQRRFDVFRGDAHRLMRQKEKQAGKACARLDKGVNGTANLTTGQLYESSQPSRMSKATSLVDANYPQLRCIMGLHGEPSRVELKRWSSAVVGGCLKRNQRYASNHKYGREESQLSEMGYKWISAYIERRIDN
ncbi:hypothetical protein K437DRAFT_158769 [Tilletiaria anomala UBC 951]|uniref:Uncharacterized protein n=1 Tax=Tilletiaria anomala (strain ATCC 24038 / CBS 436.72 / UBC 951) TaxID=1037660 RepID=A0A066VUW9_TILAU|nr:uncharacterized protein K437DRAFT_158769 [Tilletiaria anomala UBC 951]KDN42609.1 hypothetical protein K437DRAFT_158769 [Tilletiaria anomala UBC 951]